MGRLEQIILLALGIFALSVHGTRSVHRRANATLLRPHGEDSGLKLRGGKNSEGNLEAAVTATVAAATVEAVKSHYPRSGLGKDPYLCLNARFNGEPCPADQCGDADGKCYSSPGRRTGVRFRISPLSTIGAFLRAESFPRMGSEEPALRLVDGWKWERDDANWIAVASPDAKSVLLSTAASWPADESRRDGIVRVLDFVGNGRTPPSPRMMPLEAAGQAEWILEAVAHDRVRLKHHRTGRYLHMPGVSGFFQALLQLWSGEPHLDSSQVPNTNTLFVLTPPEAVQELKNLGLVHSNDEDPYSNYALHFEIPYFTGVQQRIAHVFTDARQYIHVHKVLVIGGLFILFSLSCFTWCCCLSSPAWDEDKAQLHRAPAPTSRQNYVRRTPRRNV
eukprot:gnl/MRDRNA2_/MRDRNA2_20040_c0_seq1.p1 gnl/MRDRNA2_/MRDRNA2_20040_c0~~gnl/MRDRNA2_/MRDRNA2_20040_c0_seq1.p1  ORF type:complete len:391 (-),score=61.52 gnl/MRDRNA2_/MRDRNA2_20040_c0_seq1:90-1262(-)